ncbi:MAG: alpha/beta hydrolase [Burkholderiales bacterium]|nr:alpha/beta hydrolase [Burkholderiales bacterium]
MNASFPLRLAGVAAVLVLSACGGGDSGEPIVSGEVRAQDARSFTVAPLSSTAIYPDFAAAANGQPSFTSLSGHEASSRWAGQLGGSAYRVEVPASWNGELVMYAHGYRGTGDVLTTGNPPIRRYLLDKGYAWAASSYSKNYYDVRAGVEDTNALALAFNSIAASNGRSLAAPSKVFITGHSMGGHVAAAAVEVEAVALANNKVRYSGSVPMCGVTGDTQLFDTFTAMQISAQAVAGVASSPLTSWTAVATQVNTALWSAFPLPATPTAIPTPTVLGENYVSIVKNLTGGERPLFRLGLQRGGSFPSSYGTFGGDGTINGILNRFGTDTNRYTYTIDGNVAGSAAINAAAQKVTVAPLSNPLRADGLRWIPQVNGSFNVPVVAIHTLGDLFVPFSMMQIYRQRADAQGSGSRLVTRAIRGISHCDFTVTEQAEAFDAMVVWEKGGAKPAGDDVVTPAVVAASNFGCTFSRPPVAGTDSATTIALRGIIAQSGATCP